MLEQKDELDYRPLVYHVVSSGDIRRFATKKDARDFVRLRGDETLIVIRGRELSITKEVNFNIN